MIPAPLSQKRILRLSLKWAHLLYQPDKRKHPAPATSSLSPRYFSCFRPGGRASSRGGLSHPLVLLVTRWFFTSANAPSLLYILCVHKWNKQTFCTYGTPRSILAHLSLSLSVCMHAHFRESPLKATLPKINVNQGGRCNPYYILCAVLPFLCTEFVCAECFVIPNYRRRGDLLRFIHADELSQPRIDPSMLHSWQRLV